MSLRMRSYFHESHTQSISESIISFFKCILALRIENEIYCLHTDIRSILYYGNCAQCLLSPIQLQSESLNEFFGLVKQL